MTKNIILITLVVFSILSPFLIKYLQNLLDIIDKSSIKNPISYLNSSALRSLFKNSIYKTSIDYNSFFNLYVIMFLSLLLTCFVWLEYLGLKRFDNYFYIFLLFLVKLFLYNLYFNQSRRINITDFLIQLSNYLVFFIISLCLYKLSQINNIESYKVFSIISLIAIDIFLVMRIEILTAIKSFYIKYILELIRYVHTLIYLNVLAKELMIINTDIKLLWLLILPILINFFIHMFFGRSINSKNQGVNKNQDRIIICIFLSIILLGDIL